MLGQRSGHLMSQQGTTLVELSVALAVLSLVTMLAIAPATVSPAPREAQVVADALRVLKHARRLAIALREPITVCAVPYPHTPDQHCGTMLREMVALVRQGRTIAQVLNAFPHGASFRGFRASKPPTFDAHGLAPSSNGRLTLCLDSTTAIDLVVSRLGRIRVDKSRRRCPA